MLLVFCMVPPQGSLTVVTLFQGRTTLCSEFGDIAPDLDVYLWLVTAPN